MNRCTATVGFWEGNGGCQDISDSVIDHIHLSHSTVRARGLLTNQTQLVRSTISCVAQSRRSESDQHETNLSRKRLHKSHKNDICVLGKLSSCVLHKRLFLDLIYKWRLVHDSFMGIKINTLTLLLCEQFKRFFLPSNEAD